MLKQNNVSVYKKFIDLLEKYRIQNNNQTEKNYTHTTMGYPKGCFNIPDNKINNFFDLYQKALKAKSNDFFYLTEVHLPQGPIIIDIDIKYYLDNEDEDNTRLYNEDDIINILKIYNNVILEYLDVDEDSFRSYILEKNKATFVKELMVDGKMRKLYKDGVHIIYPLICVTT